MSIVCVLSILIFSSSSSSTRMYSPLATSYPRPMSSFSTGSPLSESTRTCFPICMRALDLDLLELVVLTQDVLAIGNLVPAPDVFLLPRIAALRVHQELLQAVAGLLVDAVERHALGARRRRIERDRTRDQRQPQVSLPVGSGRHGQLLRFAGNSTIPAGCRAKFMKL